MKTKSSLVLLALLAGLFLAPTAVAGDDRPDLAAVPKVVRTAMMNGEYEGAIEALAQLIQEEPDDADFWLYLTAVAEQHAGRPNDALATLERLERDHAASRWFQKSRFRRAELLREKRDYEGAEAIYEEAAKRLRSEERQGELAAIYIEFADEYSIPSEEPRPDAGGIDYARAYHLYSRVLELGPPAASREYALFRMAICKEELQIWGEAIHAYTNYVTAFDPSERGSTWVDDAALGRVFEARYRLGRAQLSAGQVAVARRTFEDLRAAIAEALAGEGPWEGASFDDTSRASIAEWDGEASFSIALTYRTNDTHEGPLAAAAYGRFLDAFPEHAKATRSAFAIASVHRGLGRFEDALESFDAVLARPAPTIDDADVREEDARLRREALFLKGLVLQQQKRYARAADVWADYTRRHPTGAEWSAAQQGIVDCEYMIGLEHRANRRFTEAREAWEGFLERHPLDGRARQLAYDLGELFAVEALWAEEEGGAADPALLRAAIEQWRKLLAKYPRTDEASRALYRTGELYETQLGELEKAIESYRACDFGSASGSAQMRLAVMTEPTLEVLTERTWRSDEAAKVKLRVRNVEELEVQLYKLDLEAYFRKHLTHRRIEDLDLDLIAADEIIEVEVADYEQYKPIEQDLELAVEGAGVWAVAVNSEEMRATTLLIRSDVDVILKSSRREVFVYAQNMKEGKPAKGVDVLVALPGTGENGACTLLELETDDDGVARGTFDELESANDVRVFAARDGHVASDGLGLQGLGISRGLSPRGYVYTDRPVYRPGDEVNWRAIVRDVKDGGYSFEEGKTYRVEIADSQGRVIQRKTLELGVFGTLSESIVLPGRAAIGQYAIRCQAPNGPVHSGNFAVMEYELQKVELTVDLERDVYYRGEEVEVSLVAAYYYGEPIAGAEVQYWTPDGRTATTTTDAEGRATFSFETRDFPGEQALAFSAVLTAENVHRQGAVYLAVNGYRATISGVRPVVLAGDSFPITLTTTAPSGDAVGRSMQVSVLRRESRPDGSWAEVLVEERDVETADESGEAHLAFALEEGGRYVVRAEGLDRFGNPVLTEQGLFVSGDEDSVQLRLLADRTRLEVGEKAAFRLVNRAGGGKCLLTFEGESILAYRLIDLEEGTNDLELLVDHEHFPNFSISAAMMLGNEFHAASAPFQVSRELRVTVTPTKETFEPGSDATLDVEVTDQLGRPVETEVSIAVVDASLFQLFPDPLSQVRAFFEDGAQRAAELRTATSCTFRYEGTTAQISEAVLAEQRRAEVRTAWAEKSVELSENLASLGDRLSVFKAEAGPPSAGFFAMEPELAAGLELQAVRGLADAPMDGAHFARSKWATGSDDFFLGGGEAGGGGGGRDRFRDSSRVMPERPRLDLSDTAYWLATATTDEDGKTQVKFRVPDKATRWRVTSRGASKESLFGQSVVEFVSRSEFFVELSSPRLLTEGDRPRFGARVHNLTGRTGTVEVKLRVSSKADTVTIPVTLELGEATVVEHLFPALEAIEDVGTLAVEVEATAKLGDQQSTARYADDVRVRPWGVGYETSKSGEITASSTIWLELPADNSYSNRSVEVFVGPGIDRMLVDEALGKAILWRSIHDAPNSLAATASDLLGASAVLEYLARTGRRSNPEYGELFERAEGLVASLVSSQVNGGWEWVARHGAEPESSGRAMVALAAARAAGVQVPPQTIESGVEYLLAAFHSASQSANERKAMLQYALAVHGRGDFGPVNRLYRERNALSPAALAYTTLALVELGSTPKATEVADVLEKIAVSGREPTGCSWPVDGNVGWNRSVIEMTALATSALQRAKPASPRVAEGIEYLLAHRPWRVARARGVAVATIAHYRGETLPANDRMKVTVRVAGGEAKTFDLSNAASGEALDVALDGVQDRRVRVELSMEGRGEPHYSAVLRGFATDVKPTGRSDSRFRITRHEYLATRPRHRGREVGTGFGIVHDVSSWKNHVENLPQGSMTQVGLSYYVDEASTADRNMAEYLLLEVPIPSGTRILEGSFGGGLGTYQMRDGSLIVPVRTTRGGGSISYTLVGRHPGEYRVLPPILRNAYAPGEMAVYRADDFNVLEKGSTSPDEYRPTPDELFHLGKAMYGHEEHDDAHAKLAQLLEGYESNLHERYLTEVANMMLFLSIDRKEPREIVRFFEIIKEKDPALFIPFDKVLAIGEAYRELEEYERALLVFRATIEETFGKDLKVAGALEGQQEFAGAADTLEDLYLEFPDLPAVVETYLTLSDKLLKLAPDAHQHASLRRAERDRAKLTLEGILLLQRFIALYPEDPLAPDAGLNLVSARLGMDDYETASTLAGEMAKRYTEPKYADAFTYTRAVAEWYLGREDEALGLLRGIADAEYEDETGEKSPSENRDLALYILGQIHHARQESKEAAEYYERVEAVFADAREALAGFRERHVELDEVTTARPGEEVKVAIRYKNVEDVELLVYSVDLMTLYLREKNLSNVTEVNLAGITPTLVCHADLEPSDDPRLQDGEATLELTEPGAYLVICRGGELHTSGLVLITDLELDIKEDNVSGRLRVQAMRESDDRFLRDVDVRVIGSGNSEFTSGETDPRGLFIADGVQGTSTVIARHEGVHFAFFRGATALAQVDQGLQQQGAYQSFDFELDKGGYLDNVLRFNDANVQNRAMNLQREIQMERKGVQVQQVK